MTALPTSAQKQDRAFPALSKVHPSILQTSRNPCLTINDRFHARAALSDATSRWHRPQNPPAQYRFAPPAGREAPEAPPKKRTREPCRTDSSLAAGCLPGRCSDEKSCVARPATAAAPCAHRIFLSERKDRNPNGSSRSTYLPVPVRSSAAPPQPRYSRG